MVTQNDFSMYRKVFLVFILTENVFFGHRIDTEYPLGLAFLVNFLQIMTFLVRQLEMQLGNPQKYNFW